DPVVHRRRITLLKKSRRIVIEDILEMAGAHEIELFFHCSERCEVEPAGRGCAIRQDGRTLRLDLPRADGAQWRVCCGSVAPILGWVSRRYDEKTPAPTIAWRARLAGRSVLRTEIAC